MKVAIIEAKTGKVVCSYPIILHGLNYKPSDEEYFAEAWKNAVGDGLVDADARDKYRFTLSQ
jgi:hypothetical protein